jgi:uncharacterized membrane protein
MPIPRSSSAIVTGQPGARPMPCAGRQAMMALRAAMGYASRPIARPAAEGQNMDARPDQTRRQATRTCRISATARSTEGSWKHPVERRAAPQYAVPALEKGLDIVEYLADQAVPMTQSQLARALNRQPGELFRMLACLEGRGYVRRDPTNGGYALTLAVPARAHPLTL